MGHRDLLPQLISTSNHCSVCLTRSVRRTRGSPVIRLGEGLSFGLSPEVELLPTGPGEARRPENANIESYTGMGWMPNSQEFIFAGNEPGHGTRFYIQSISNGKARPLTVEGFTGIGRSIPISPDGKQFVAFNQHNHAWNLCQVEGGKCGRLAGSEEQDDPVQWSADGKYIYVGLPQPVPSFWRIELATRHRQLWKQVAILDPVAISEIRPTSITPDGKSFAYGCRRFLDQLYLVDGVN